MQDGCKVYMVLNGSCFMVTWIIFENHLLEVGLTQNLNYLPRGLKVSHPQIVNTIPFVDISNLFQVKKKPSL